MSQQQEEVEMKTMNKDEVENEEDSGSEYTGSEYTEDESESEARIKTTNPCRVLTIAI